MGVVLGVAGLVEERLPVVLAADRLDDEHHLPRHLDRRAERARRLGRARLEVEVDVRLRPQVDPEVGQRRLERRQHAIRRVELIELRRPEEPRDVPRAGVREPDPEARAEQALPFAFPELLGVVEEGGAFVTELVEAEAEALVELVVVLRAERTHCLAVDLDRVEVDRVQVLVEQP